MPEDKDKMSKEAKKGSLSRRKFLTAAGVAGLGLLAGCSPITKATESPPTPPETSPTAPPLPTQEPTSTSTATAEPTQEPEPTPTEVVPPTVEGESVVGESLYIGGYLPKKEKSVEELSSLIDFEERGWKVVTDTEGKASCFLGEIETGEVVAVLAQGPKDWMWDRDTRTWRKDSEVIIPDVIIPGGWNPDSDEAGPSFFPEFAFMIQESTQFRNIVLLPLEQAENIAKDTTGEEISQVEIFRNQTGEVIGGMWVGTPKEAKLEEGQSIERDPETGTLTIVGVDNKPVKSMVVRWPEIKAEEDVEKIGAWTIIEEEAEEEIVVEEERLVKIEVAHQHQAEVMGVPVVFTIGLHPGLVNAPNYPIKDVTVNNDVLFPHHLTGEQVSATQLLGELVLRNHWKAWQEDSSERGSVSFESYLDLVKQGEGKYTVAGSRDYPELSIREKHKLLPIEVDPSKPITVVLSNRADPMVQFIEGAGFWITQLKNGEMAIEITFMELARKACYEDFAGYGYALADSFRKALGTLIFPEEIQGNNVGQIGGLVHADRDLIDFLLKPRQNMLQWALKAEY